MLFVVSKKAQSAEPWPADEHPRFFQPFDIQLLDWKKLIENSAHPSLSILLDLRVANWTVLNGRAGWAVSFLSTLHLSFVVCSLDRRLGEC